MAKGLFAASPEDSELLLEDHEVVFLGLGAR